MPKIFPELSPDDVIEKLRNSAREYHVNYLAMFSTWYGGIIRDPWFMMVPIDDHMVHRGDGIFEAFACVGGNIYGLGRHLDRLERSAALVQMTLPLSRGDLEAAIRQTIQAGGRRDCLIRLFVSRGPGDFTTNPYECPESQLYIVVTTLDAPAPEKAERGLVVKTSGVPIKPSYFACVKSCNYLPNVMMDKEARDEGVDLTISVDEQGFLAEGSTANVGIITQDKRFWVPRFERILRGTTLVRAMELASELVAKGELREVAERDITPEMAATASEMMVFGTTIVVLPVVRFNDIAIGDGRPGPFFQRFSHMLEEDFIHGSEMLTPVWD